MWPFNRKKKKQLRELKEVSSAFAIIGEMNRRGLIHWQVKDKLLLIEESLALLQLAQGEKGFRKFLEQVAQWQNYQLISETYDRQRINAEAKAVREAESVPGKVLTADDIQRIRLNARNTLQFIDPDEIKSLITEFDIMVIRAAARSADEAVEENGQLLALGHYDGKQLEMAMYDDIKNALI